VYLIRLFGHYGSYLFVILGSSARDCGTVALVRLNYVSCEEMENGCKVFLGGIEALDEVSNRNLLGITLVVDCRGDWTKARGGLHDAQPLPASVTHFYMPINGLTKKSTAGLWDRLSTPDWIAATKWRNSSSQSSLRLAAANRCCYHILECIVMQYKVS
jgi:hypothetical protein